MPRFVLMEIYKPPLSSEKIYIETKDKINLMAGYNVDHNILLYNIDDEVINGYLKNKDGVIYKSTVKIRVRREEYNTRVIYNYIKYKYNNNEATLGDDLEIKLPSYGDIKDILTRKVYDKVTGNYLYSTDSMYLNNSPCNKYYKTTVSYLYIGGAYNIQLGNSLEDITTYLNTICKNKRSLKPTKSTVVEYYAMCCDTKYIEDNYLDIYPYEYNKYLPKNDAVIDKLYKVKALEAIGLTDEISSRWVEGKSVLAVVLGEEENAIENIIFPPASSNYGISGPFGDDEFGEFDE
jgi:hypothetical protein